MYGRILKCEKILGNIFANYFGRRASSAGESHIVITISYNVEFRKDSCFLSAWNFSWKEMIRVFLATRDVFYEPEI